MILAPLLDFLKVAARVRDIKTGYWEVARRTTPAPIDG